jgi:hypothetical protein
MAKYDDASWHYEGDYPEDLPPENGATHIGMFLAWCIIHDLLAEEGESAEDAEEEIQSVKERKMTGAEFLINVCDETLCDDDLSDTGNQFAEDYYGGDETDSEFAKKHGDYFSDYGETFNISSTDGNLDADNLYRVENTWENYDRIARKIDERFLEWKKFHEDRRQADGDSGVEP